MVLSDTGITSCTGVSSVVRILPETAHEDFVSISASSGILSCEQDARIVSHKTMSTFIDFIEKNFKRLVIKTY